MAFCKLLTVLVLICNTGDLLGAEVRSSIVGGKDAQKGSWPWMVEITIMTENRDRWDCGGTILTNEWVLTAASCWDKSRKPDWSRSIVWVGSHSLKKKSERFVGVVSVVVHPDYKDLSHGYVNDIALVKLKKKLTFAEHVRAVGLPSVEDTFDSSSECWITGWGYVKSDVPLPDPQTLQQLKIPIIEQSICQNQYPELTSEMLCAGDMAGGKGACKGDYGSPLVCRAGGRFVQVGIMSYGGCALPKQPDIYTQVSKYLRFINDYTRHAEEASAEV